MQFCACLATFGVIRIWILLYFSLSWTSHAVSEAPHFPCSVNESEILLSLLYSGQVFNSKKILADMIHDAVRVDIYHVYDGSELLEEWSDFRNGICNSASSSKLRFLEFARRTGLGDQYVSPHGEMNISVSWKVTNCLNAQALHCESKGYHIVLDDTLIYPENYLEFMTHMVDSFDRSVILGLYGRRTDVWRLRVCIKYF